MRPLLTIGLAFLLFAGCAEEEAPTLFVERAPEETGVDFVNELPPEAGDLNIVDYLYYYNGGGVAVGDVDGDGLPDLYFTSNLGPNRLYRNRGDFQFEDVTEQAGVGGSGNWTTGAAMADVDGDGHLDLYVAAVGGFRDRTGRNELYLNRGDGTFTEAAAAYGLDFEGFSTHAAFFDYDRDGDLDLYLLNHSTHFEGAYGRAALLRPRRHARAGDRLYRNDPGSGPGQARRFTDVSEEAGIRGSALGYGLSVTVSDLDLDGCPDLYVANDFHEDDYLYYNNCDGTFTEVGTHAMGHFSLSSMGSDAADFNNDGRPDVVVLDMLPEQEEILKTSASIERHDVYAVKRKMGYHHQLSRNTLQLNVGGRRFSEIAPLAGIEATDWSWAALFADLDLDGWKDLFVTNGIYHRPNDLDYVNEVARPDIQASLNRGVSAEALGLLQKMPNVPVSNYAFRNEGAPGSGPPDQSPGQARQALTFTNRAAEWGLDAPGFSNGAAYGDLDRDGDLDLVVNNINAPASIYENRADTLLGHHHLTVALEGSGRNTSGIGAKVLLRHEGRLQLLEQMPTRGFQSSVDHRLHFGLGSTSAVDSLVVIWPDGRSQTLTDVAADRTVTLRQEEARAAPILQAAPAPLFEDWTEKLDLPYRHTENTFLDFSREPLIPHKLSTEGPALAVGDVDGDGLDDLFAGGAKRQAGQLFLQRPDGSFTPGDSSPWRADSLHEDVDAAFFDADGDGDLDLYVVSAGNEFWGTAEALADRLYRNDGRGRFERAGDALPDHYAHGSRVVPADYDGDGDTDLFVGSRTIPWRYGHTPRSVLLENDGRGRFTDITDRAAPELAEAGMVTDALWSDYDADGRLDLIVVGEWMPIALFRNAGGGRLERQAGGLEGTEGWWNRVAAADFDGDGDTDLVAGNLGLNSVIRASPERPARLYLNDFDGDGRSDPVLTDYDREGVSYPVAPLDLLQQQMRMLEERFPSYTSFGAARIEEVFTREELAGTAVREATTFATSYAENNGDGTFSLCPLPVEAQFAPVRAFLVEDFDGDRVEDLLLAGNFFGVGPLRSRYDAGHGLLLRGDGSGRFTAVMPAESGLWLEGEVRDLRLLHRPGGGRLIVAARNDDALQLIRPVRLSDSERLLAGRR